MPKNVCQTISVISKILTINSFYLQGLDPEMTALQELFRQIPDPTPMQRTRMDQLNARWSDLWELSLMYVKRLVCTFPSPIVLIYFKLILTVSNLIMSF